MTRGSLSWEFYQHFDLALRCNEVTGPEKNLHTHLSLPAVSSATGHCLNLCAARSKLLPQLRQLRVCLMTELRTAFSATLLLSRAPCAHSGIRALVCALCSHLTLGWKATHRHGMLCYWCRQGKEHRVQAPLACGKGGIGEKDKNVE